MSAFRADIKNQGITTTSIVSSPLLLEEIQSPRDTVLLFQGLKEILFHSQDSVLIVV